MDALVDRNLRSAEQADQPRRDAEIVEFLFIGELSRLVGLSARAIRFYEKEGLIMPARHGRFRVYRKSDEARLRAVCRLRALGLSIAAIRGNLDRFLDPQSAQNRQDTIALLESHMAAQVRRQTELQEEQALARALHEELSAS